jgi:predicted transcriptional regulator
MVKKLFSLDEHIARELEIVAKALNTTQKDIVEKALDFYFDYTDAVVADKIIEDVENKKIKTYSKDEAYKILGVE